MNGGKNLRKRGKKGATTSLRRAPAEHHNFRVQNSAPRVRRVSTFLFYGVPMLRHGCISVVDGD